MATARELNQISQLENLGRYIKVSQKTSDQSVIPILQGTRDAATGKNFIVSPNGGSGQIVNLSNAGGIAYGQRLSAVINSGGVLYSDTKNI